VALCTVTVGRAAIVATGCSGGGTKGSESAECEAPALLDLFVCLD
jgi:hypothetical protein